MRRTSDQVLAFCSLALAVLLPAIILVYTGNDWWRILLGEAWFIVWNIPPIVWFYRAGQPQADTAWRTHPALTVTGTLLMLVSLLPTVVWAS